MDVEERFRIDKARSLAKLGATAFSAVKNKAFVSAHDCFVCGSRRRVTDVFDGYVSLFKHLRDHEFEDTFYEQVSSLLR